jgi:UDP-N-acetylglucosamine:LPS N-acetylglucosamine transferase
MRPLDWKSASFNFLPSSFSGDGRNKTTISSPNSTVAPLSTISAISHVGQFQQQMILRIDPRISSSLFVTKRFRQHLILIHYINFSPHLQIQMGVDFLSQVGQRYKSIRQFFF